MAWYIVGTSSEPDQAERVRRCTAAGSSARRRRSGPVRRRRPARCAPATRTDRCRRAGLPRARRRVSGSTMPTASWLATRRSTGSARTAIGTRRHAHRRASGLAAAVVLLPRAHPHRRRNRHGILNATVLRPPHGSTAAVDGTADWARNGQRRSGRQRRATSNRFRPASRGLARLVPGSAGSIVRTGSHAGDNDIGAVVVC